MCEVDGRTREALTGRLEEVGVRARAPVHAADMAFRRIMMVVVCGLGWILGFPLGLRLMVD